MAVRIGINGFGRIGRLVLRAAAESKRNDVEFVAVNDLGSVEANAHLLKYDSVHGTYPGSVSTDGDSMTVDGHKIKVFAERDPKKLPWGDLGIDVSDGVHGYFLRIATRPPSTWSKARRRCWFRHHRRVPTRPSFTASTMTF
jgi:glyceraldehyde 3-phosphate dehydrogenase